MSLRCPYALKDQSSGTTSGLATAERSCRSDGPLVPAPMVVGPPDVFDDQQPAVRCLDGGLDAAMQWSGDLLVLAFHDSSFTSAGALTTALVCSQHNRAPQDCSRPRRMARHSFAARPMSCRA